MVSSKFVNLIESHADRIADGVLRRLSEDRRASHIARLPQSELRESCQRVLKNLGHWLTASSENEIARHYEERGRVRAVEGVPLHEAVLFLFILKEKMLDYTRDQGFTQSTVDLYAEEELEHQVGRFFDSATYHLIRGYESARTGAAAQAIA
ncbi:MAG: RsbRD N-terminal domain-containing protein [Bryobacteraceae bacterium]|nr:RsbRD N-terminal domain-containing protein [Bryobacteraceae bacterium]